MWVVWQHELLPSTHTHTHTHTHTYIHTLSRSHALPQCWILALAVLYARWLAESCGLTSRLAATYRTLGCLKCSPRAQAWGLARDGEPIKQGREGEAKRPPPCGRGGATTGSLCQGPLKVCIFKFFSSLVLSAALQMWSVPYMLLHSLAVFHLVISRHLRKQQRFFFFFPPTHFQCLILCQLRQKNAITGLSEKHIHQPFPSYRLSPVDAYACGCIISHITPSALEF